MNNKYHIGIEDLAFYMFCVCVYTKCHAVRKHSTLTERRGSERDVTVL